MSNTLYPAATEGFLDGTIPMLSGDIRVLLIDTAFYTYSATDTFLTSIPALARVATSNPLTSKTTTVGVFNATGATFAAVTGATVEAFVLYLHTGVDATARLIGYWDTSAGLPLTPNGTTVSISWTPYVFRIAGTCP